MSRQQLMETLKNIITDGFVNDNLLERINNEVVNIFEIAVTIPNFEIN